MIEQLALEVSLKEEQTFQNYLGNSLVVSALKQMIRHQSEFFIFLYGAPLSGKTHLARASSVFARSMGLSVFYVSFKTVSELHPKIFEQLETHALVILEDIDYMLGDAAWEESLFHFYNRAKEAGTRLLVTATATAKKLKINLADLSSRLLSGLTLHIEDLNDETKIELLTSWASDRGLVLTNDVAFYLVTHYSRRIKDLLEAFEKLDKASMQQQRRLTIPFVKQVLN